jgi:hypothetical protein
MNPMHKQLKKWVYYRSGDRVEESLCSAEDKSDYFVLLLKPPGYKYLQVLCNASSIGSALSASSSIESPTRLRRRWGLPACESNLYPSSKTLSVLMFHLLGKPGKSRGLVGAHLACTHFATGLLELCLQTPTNHSPPSKNINFESEFGYGTSGMNGESSRRT